MFDPILCNSRIGYFFNTMGRNINSFKLTKSYIFSKLSPITIFSVYLDIHTEIIKDCINNNTLILSPFRDDKRPSCGFRYDNKGSLKCRDFGGYFWGDCFDAAALVINNTYNLKLDVHKPKDFIHVLRHITIIFKDIFYGEKVDPEFQNQLKEGLNNIKRTKSIIDLVTRQWNQYDIDYWKQFGVDIKYLNINFVYPIEQYYINKNINREPLYYYDKNDPCYAYFLGKDKNGINNFKLYFPKRTKNLNRFITNCNHLEGIINLDKHNYDYIIITKSSKDRLSIGNTLLNIASLYGELKVSIGVINIPHETYKLREIEYEWLSSKLNENGKLVSLMDNDRTGYNEAIWLRDNYYITPIIINKKYNCKDFAELFNKYGLEYIYNIIPQIINSVENYGNKLQYIKEKKKSIPLPY